MDPEQRGPQARRRHRHRRGRPHVPARIIGDVVEPERIDTYLDRGPEMLSFVLKNSPLKMCWVPGYSDYYPESARRPARRPVDRAEAVQRQQARRLICPASSRRTARCR